MKFKIIAASDPYYHEELMLRFERIEKPKGLPPGFERRQDEGESFHLIALDKKQLVGCIVCQPKPEQEGEVFHLAISEEYRGKPFLRQMFSALEEFLSQKGISHVYVFAGEESKEIYSHLGFTPEGPVQEAFGMSYQKMGKSILCSAA